MYTDTTLLTLWILIGTNRKKWCSLRAGFATCSQHLFYVWSLNSFAVSFSRFLGKKWKNLVNVKKKVKRASGRHPKNVNVRTLASNVLTRALVCVSVCEWVCLHILLHFAIAKCHISSQSNASASVRLSPKRASGIRYKTLMHIHNVHIYIHKTSTT